MLRSFTGLRVSEFEQLLNHLLPLCQAAEELRLSRLNRQRAIGGWVKFELVVSEQVLVTVMRLRMCPTHETLGFLFGVSAITIGRIVTRWVPLLERNGRDGMRLPDPGKPDHRSLGTLL